MEGISGNPYNPAKYTDTAANFGFNTAAANAGDGRIVNAAYQGYSARFPNGAQPASAIGDVFTNLFYSTTVGPVAVIVLCKCVGFV